MPHSGRRCLASRIEMLVRDRSKLFEEGLPVWRLAERVRRLGPESARGWPGSARGWRCGSRPSSAPSIPPRVISCSTRSMRPLASRAGATCASSSACRRHWPRGPGASARGPSSRRPSPRRPRLLPDPNEKGGGKPAAFDRRPRRPSDYFFTRKVVWQLPQPSLPIACQAVSMTAKSPPPAATASLS